MPMLPETIPAMLLYAAKKYDKKDAFQFKREDKWADVSHREVVKAVDDLSRGLVATGFRSRDRIAILSENRLEWAIADFAILTAGCVNVPVYATLPAAQVAYILDHSEARALFVSTREQFEKIMEIRDQLQHLHQVFSFDAIDGVEGVETLDALVEKGKSLDDGKTLEDRAAAISPDDWASIIYTSGTTGDPKGVILTHNNITANVNSAMAAFDIGPHDKALSFLPLSHVFERTCGFYAGYSRGVTIAYAENIDAVSQNLLEVNPTIVVSVPRFFEKIYGRVFDTATAGSIVKKNIFFWAVNVGKIHSKQFLEKRVTRVTRTKYGLAKKLVFAKMKAKTGGRIRFFVSGGAPLSREIAEFFHAAGLPILEGYGSTETAPIVTANTLEHIKFGTVGRPINNVEIKIAEDGEILARGPNVMVGYYKDTFLTSEAIKDGWYHSGDIGYIDGDGFVVITDRKKDLIVTAGGKNVAPQPIEGLLKTSKYVTQAIVIGDKRKFVSAIIVPNFENIRAFADAIGIEYGDDKDLTSHPRVIKKVEDEITRKSVHLAGFERVKKFILLDKDFTIEDNELTPTLKFKRRKIEEKHKAEINALYDAPHKG